MTEIKECPTHGIVLTQCCGQPQEVIGYYEERKSGNEGIVEQAGE
jgi:hypothetical protein